MPAVEPRPSSSSSPGENAPGRVGAEDPDVDDQHHHADHVVGDRRPHHRAEPAAGVEDLPDQHEHPVEEHLGQAQPGEVDERVALGGQRGVVPAGAEEDRHDVRRGHDQQRGHQAQEQPGQGDHPVRVGLAAVLVVLHRPDQLGHQHGVEDAAGQQDVEHVRDRVGDREDVGVQQVAERGREQDRADVPAHPRDDGAGRHHRAVGDDRPVVGWPRSCRGFRAPALAGPPHRDRDRQDARRRCP